MQRRQLKQPAFPLTSFSSVDSAVVCLRMHRSSNGPRASISKLHSHSAHTRSWSHWHRGVSSNVISTLLISGVSDRLVPEDVRQPSISPNLQSQVFGKRTSSGYLQESIQKTASGGNASQDGPGSTKDGGPQVSNGLAKAYIEDRFRLEARRFSYSPIAAMAQQAHVCG